MFSFFPTGRAPKAVGALGRASAHRTGAHHPFAGLSQVSSCAGGTVGCSAVQGSASICLGTQQVDKTAFYSEERCLGSEIFLWLLSLPTSFSFASSVP